jgi:SAM-dependent methyltransferase
MRRLYHGGAPTPLRKRWICLDKRDKILCMETEKNGLTPSNLEDTYYAILAGGARFVLFASVLDMNLPPLFGAAAANGRTADEIIDALKIDRHRGRKWLHALLLGGFLEPVPGEAQAHEHGHDHAHGEHGHQHAPAPAAPFVSNLGLGQPPVAEDKKLRLSAVLRGMFGEDGQSGWFYREFLRYYRASMMHPLSMVLHGAPIHQAVRYPPTDHADMLLLHEWMRNGARYTLGIIRRHVDFGQVSRLLDVGGGDGTMALELWKAFANLNITVFNLPGPATMVQEQAARIGAWERVSALPGDFRTDALPGGNDMVMFSRVLADWPPELCRELIKKAHTALLPDGKLVIAEPLADQNPDLAMSWEFSYLPYDDFGLLLYKTLPFYVQMLVENGFKLISVHPRDETTIHCVIVAQKVS